MRTFLLVDMCIVYILMIQILFLDRIMFIVTLEQNVHKTATESDHISNVEAKI